jgi:7-carboxy-7-deazaguanine synthase
MLKLSSKPISVIQGEGPLIGKRMVLLRVKGCNLHCPMCDEPDSLDNTKDTILMKNKEIINYIKKSGINNLMITGGEPLLYQEEILEFANDCINNKIIFDNVNIETNGSILPESIFRKSEFPQPNLGQYYFAHNLLFSISPKIGGLISGVNKDPLFFIDNIKTLKLSNHNFNFIIKIVINPNNIEILNTIENDINYNIIKKLRDMDHNVYLMPLGATREDQIKNSPTVIDLCIKYGYEFSPRTHILIYDTKKGV